MRLKHIKLAGFKSFVDPTTVKLTGNLVGIVGPNGCGKSNVIDAVRWVMGEGSAKNLRGESMADVIFNGSTGRAPVGQASIELCFDNSDASLGGEYATYSEIVIRRLIGRDGVSSYYLNNTRCRRKDIVEIFLGTGLGPRSYAIIEQGTISRIIEAKPEELRAYLEEVAGVSKYKERRKETESRIGQTQENLARLADLRSEIDRQLSHLQRQAAAAERYKTYREEHRLVEAQLLALNWQQLQQGSGDREQFIRTKDVELEQVIAELRHLDSSNEQNRERLIEQNDLVQEIQERYYRVGADLARIEQDLQHRRERMSQIQNDLELMQHQQHDANAQLQQDDNAQQAITLQLNEIAPKIIEAKSKAEQSKKHLETLQQAVQDWQTQWDQFNQQASSVNQKAEVEQTQIQHIEQRSQRSHQRLQQIESERAQLVSTTVSNEIEILQEKAELFEDQIASTQSILEETASKIKEHRTLQQQKQESLVAQNKEFQNLQAEQAALQALQQVALGKQDSTVVNWLEQHNLAGEPRLAEQLQVETGWDLAVETVLGSCLQAVCVNDFTTHVNYLSELANSSIAFFVDEAASVSKAGQFPSLSSKVIKPKATSTLLDGIYVADSMQSAVEMLPQLQAQESVITADGIWLGKNWLRISRQQKETTGVIKREHQLQEIAEKLAIAEEQAAAIEQQIEHHVEAMADLDQEREEKQGLLLEHKVSLGDARGKLQQQQQRLQQMQQRDKQLLSELTEIEKHLEQDKAALQSARQEWEQALQVIAVNANQREQLLQMRDGSRESINIAKTAADEDRNLLHELEVQQRSLQASKQGLLQAIDRLQKQMDHFQQRDRQLSANLSENNQPITHLQQQLDGLLSQRLLIEQELTTAKKQADEVEYQLREITRSRNDIEERAQSLRTILEKQKLELQGSIVKRSTIEEQLQQKEYSLDTLLSEMPADAEINLWQENLDRIAKRIERLGAINLAAIEEYQSESERKNYLDTQNDDLVEALTTLQNAMRKIDQQSREQLHETFDKLNANFKALFPKVFGGGEAYLELTSDDLLEAGITLMARPPGKRNSTIHLLSGGEKALTAVALVFALFQLNPAPFCMLDEVDAPLDEVNVGRFCELVREMSKQVQFVVITHNKNTMELVDHLMGVTMSEPGVSRMVAVDVEEALAFAEA